MAPTILYSAARFPNAGLFLEVNLAYVSLHFAGPFITDRPTSSIAEVHLSSTDLDDQIFIRMLVDIMVGHLER